MSKFVFVGADDPTEDAVCVVGGVEFPRGEEVDVEDAALAAKLSSNPAFAVVEDKPRGRKAAD